MIGKTFTFIGEGSGKDMGIIPRAAYDIFARQDSFDCKKTTCQVKLSILEIYQEKLKDLLTADLSKTSTLSSSNVSCVSNLLRVREQVDGTVWVEGLSETMVTNAEEFIKLLHGALKRRIVGSHNMNNISSRSHLCCMVSIDQTIHDTGVIVSSKMHFIDLAGSEMVSFYDFTSIITITSA